MDRRRQAARRRPNLNLGGGDGKGEAECIHHRAETAAAAKEEL